MVKKTQLHVVVPESAYTWFEKFNKTRVLFKYLIGLLMIILQIHIFQTGLTEKAYKFFRIWISTKLEFAKVQKV